MIITIDGPVASGKSSIARALAEKLDIYYLNTGLLFRALAYVLLKKGYNKEDFERKNLAVSDIAMGITQCTYEYHTKDGGHILVDGNDITSQLKTGEVDTISSFIGNNVIAREYIMIWLRSITKNKDLVTEGRDTGSVIFPYADYKFFLTASLRQRAKRWQDYQKVKGNAYRIEQAMQIILDRDMRDETRTIAPLVVPQGAITIDNSSLNVEQTLQKLLEIIKK